MKKIAEIVKTLGSQAKLAELLGVAPQAVSQWVSGVRTPGPEAVALIFHVLEVDLRSLYPEIFFPEARAISGKPLRPQIPRANLRRRAERRRKERRNDPK